VNILLSLKAIQMKFVQLFDREIKLLKPKLNYSHFKLKNSKMFKIPAQKTKLEIKITFRVNFEKETH
jgi:hypothetical protein